MGYFDLTSKCPKIFHVLFAICFLLSCIKEILYFNYLKTYKVYFMTQDMTCVYCWMLHMQLKRMCILLSEVLEMS